MSSEAYSFEPPVFLKDSANELRRHKEFAAKNLKVFTKYYEQELKEFRDVLQRGHHDMRLKQLHAAIQKKKREIALTESKSEKLLSSLETLRKESNSLHSKVIEKKDELVTLSQEIHHKKDVLANLEDDYKNMQDDLRKKYEAVTTAKMRYKSYLDLHVRLESSGDEGDVYVVSFADKPNTSVKLQLADENQWQLMEITPPHSDFQRLAEFLKTSHDVPGVISFIKENLKK